MKINDLASSILLQLSGFNAEKTREWNIAEVNFESNFLARKAKDEQLLYAVVIIC